MLELGIIAGLGVALVYVLFKSSFRVDEGHLAVLVAFGKAESLSASDQKKLKTYGPASIGRSRGSTPSSSR